MSSLVLGIESSCDETGVALVRTRAHGVPELLAHALHSQVAMHADYGGVVPELASRDHIRRVIPLANQVLAQSGQALAAIDIVAFTRGPGLLGSLLVGSSFAKGLSQSLGVPLVDVNHLQGHVLAHFISQGHEGEKFPAFPFLCLLVSGGNSQIVLVRDYLDMEVIGQTIDDAAGEAFDKCAKVMGLPYPGGPHVDRLAKEGNPKAFKLNKPQISGYDYSFSGLKTSFLYLLRDEIKKNPDFVQENTADLCASLQATIIEILMKKLLKASEELNIRQVAVAGGVSANSGLRNAFHDYAQKYGWEIFIPPFAFTTDNAAMIAITGYYKYLRGEFSSLEDVPYARVSNLLV